MTVPRVRAKPLACIELFSGVGGLALGASLAGFRHLAMIERDCECCATIRHNQAAGHPLARNWPLIEADVCTVAFSKWFGKASLVCGGPPCQPFSIGGKGHGEQDHRDMFPEAVRAVREIQPLAFVFENVRGLLRPGFSNYVEYIRLQLKYPQLPKCKGEESESHLRRLQHCHVKGDGPEPIYQVEIHTANAANFGVPQNRERVFLVGFRADLHADWNFPIETHSREALLREMATGNYWRRHKVPKKHRFFPQISEPSLFDTTQGMAPWKTLRDALLGLGPPNAKPQLSNHVFIDGARTYTGHTGSILDMPAKTVKAGDHGVPGGENMVVLDGGTVRYLTVRESARVQTFPDDFEFPAARTISMRQLGNAVPCELARVVLLSVHKAIAKAIQSRRPQTV